MVLVLGLSVLQYHLTKIDFLGDGTTVLKLNLDPGCSGRNTGTETKFLKGSWSLENVPVVEMGVLSAKVSKNIVYVELAQERKRKSVCASLIYIVYSVICIQCL